jgi:hypothetical protein
MHQALPDVATHLPLPSPFNPNVVYHWIQFCSYPVFLSLGEYNLSASIARSESLQYGRSIVNPLPSRSDFTFCPGFSVSYCHLLGNNTTDIKGNERPQPDHLVKERNNVEKPLSKVGEHQTKPQMMTWRWFSVVYYYCMAIFDYSC